MKSQLKFAAVLACFALGAPALAASALYGHDSGGQLILIDQTTAATTAIGTATDTRIGLVRSSITGTSYARSFNTLFTVDLNTGVSTPIGASGGFLTGLTLNAAQTTGYSIDQSSGEFYAIDLATGAASLIGATGISVPLDLSTDNAGVVYAAGLDGRIYTIDTSTGAAAFVTQFLADGLTSIDFDSSGSLYGVGLGTDNLYKDILTGGTLIGTLNPQYFDVRGIEFVNSAAVPEPATWTLMIGGFGLVGHAMRNRRRVEKISLL